MLTPLARRVISRIRRLNRFRAFGAVTRVTSEQAVKASVVTPSASPCSRQGSMILQCSPTATQAPAYPQWLITTQGDSAHKSRARLLIQSTLMKIVGRLSKTLLAPADLRWALEEAGEVDHFRRRSILFRVGDKNIGNVLVCGGKRIAKLYTSAKRSSFT